jgi:CheY-like chemotaxis protein
MPQNQRPDADLIPPTLSLSARPFMGTVAGPGPRPGNNWRQELPLQGVTILAVEDSRFACEALRLIARRAGARLRRAETMAAARDHLRVYRPDVVLIDLGLPDGRGDALIRDLAQGPRRPPVVMGTSGGVEGRALALAAGADGFLDKSPRVSRSRPTLWRCTTIWPLPKGRCKADPMPTSGAMSAPLSPGSPATAKMRP